MKNPVMRKTGGAAAALLLGTILLGCVSAAQPFFSGTAPKEDGYGLVILYRPANILGMATIPVVTIDDAPIAELMSGSYFPFYLLPGDSRVVNRLKSYGDFGLRMQDISIKKGKEHYYRYSVNPLGGFDMTYVNTGQALNEASGCRLADDAVPLSQQPKPLVAGRAAPAEQNKGEAAERKPSTAAVAPAGARLPVVSVLDFKVEGISVAEGALIIDMLSNAIVKTRRFVVIDRSQREKLLEVETSKAMGTASEVYKSLEELVDNCQSIAATLME